MEGVEGRGGEAVYRTLGDGGAHLSDSMLF